MMPVTVETAESLADSILVRQSMDVPAEFLTRIPEEKLLWYLLTNYSDSQDILIDSNGKVNGGALLALIERLTAYDCIGSPSYSKVFLLMFKTFTNLDTMVGLLAQQFWIQPPNRFTLLELDDWKMCRRDIIRTRCVLRCLMYNEGSLTVRSVLSTFMTMIQDKNVLQKED
jgi:son of sevenless-like protein